jgi:CRISP-associated protein Cas1
MAVVYVREQGSIVRKRGGRMLVEKDGEHLLEIPLLKTTGVALYGNVQVTTQAMSELLERGIPMALYTRHGRLKGQLTPELSKNITLRLAHYAATRDDGRSLEIARAIVRAKLWNSAAVVEDYRSNYPSDGLKSKWERLREAADRALEARSFNELLGYEGTGAAGYFEAFAEMNRSGLPFAGRDKYPPPDPINALLSLGYTMLMHKGNERTAGNGGNGGTRPVPRLPAPRQLRPAVAGAGPSGAVSRAAGGPDDAARGE